MSDKPVHPLPENEAGWQPSGAELRDLALNAAVALQWIGPDGVVLWANQAELELLGCARADYVGRKVVDFHADLAAALDMLARMVRGETLRDLPARLRRADGTVRHVSISADARFENGAFAHTRCFTRDVTAKVQAETALQENEWRLRYAMESAKLTYVEVDVARREAHTAPNFAAVMGYTSPPAQEADAGAGVQALLEHVVADDRPRVNAALREFIAGTPVGKIDYRVLGDDSNERWIESRWSFEVGADGKSMKSFATNLDITDRKLATEALRISEERCRLALDAAELGTFNIDYATGTFSADDRLHAIFGAPAGRLDYEQAFAIVHPDDRAPLRDAVAAATRADNPAPFSVEYRVVHPGGAVRWVFGKGRANHVQKGLERQLVSFDGTVADITDRRLAEAALREVEAFNRSIIESSPDCIKVLDLDGNLLSMLSGQALLGIEDIRPFVNRSWLEFWHGPDRVAAQAAVAGAAAGAASSASRFVGFFCTLRGEPRWWDVSVSPILDAAGVPVRLLAVSRDVTQRRRAEGNLELLASVSEDLIRLTSVDEMMRTVGTKLAAHLELSLCAFVEINEAADEVVIAHDWHRQNVPSLVGVHRLADFVGPEFIRLARRGEIIVVHDVANDPRTDPAEFTALKIASFVCVPLIRNGEWRFALCLYRSEPCEWRSDEIEVTRELTLRIWTRLERLRSDAALAESEERYRKLFGSIDEGFCIIEKVEGSADAPLDFRYVEANPAFEVQSGARDVVGKTIRQTFPGISEDWFHTYDTVLRTGVPIRFKRSLDPAARVLELYAFRVEPEALRRVAVIFEDVTERDRAELALRLSEERFRALFDRGPIAMYSCDMSGTIREYNRVAVALWGQAPAPGATDAQFRSRFRFFRSDGTPLPLSRSPMADVLSGKVTASYDKEVTFERADGVRISAIANIVPLKSAQGETTGAINCFYDVTERILLQRKTQEQAQVLADLDRRKDEFLAMLSHELRNPLAPISNALHLLRLQKGEGPIQQQARGIIERQVGQLKHLIDDLLEVSRINTGRVQMRLEHIVISGVVERAVESAQALIAEHRHALKLSMPALPIWLHGDAARLEQVLVNLLTNAAKYTDDGGEIWLSVAQEGDVAVLRVRDTGIGISAELLPRIFDLFTQAERTLDRSQGGLGIGLCLVQRLVELHGGSVAAESVLGQGSEFIVRLPALPAPAAASAAPAALQALPCARRCRVLVVDDNVDAAQALAQVLQLSGHEVRMAFDGPRGLQAAVEFLPNVVLLDIGLPGMTGLEVARRLRLEAATANIVLVAMTGYGQDADRQRSRDAGFDHHLTKPADFNKLERILADVSDSLLSCARLS